MSPESADIQPGIFTRMLGPDVSMSRRAFLAMGAVALGIGVGLYDIKQQWDKFIELDTKLGEAIWQPTNAELLELRPFTPDNRQYPWLTVSGLGHTSSRLLAGQISDMNPKINPAYPVVPNQGTTLRSMAEVTLPLFKSAEAVNVVGSSMGGPVSLEIGRLAAQNGSQKPIDTLLLVSSPFSMQNARNHVAARIIDELYQHANLRGGPLTKGMTTLIENWQNDGWDPTKLWPELQTLPREATQGNSPAVWVSQLVMLDQIDLWKNREAYKGIVTPDTKWYYVCSKDPAMDKVVDVESSIIKYQKLSEYLGSTLHVVRVAGMGHADVPNALPSISETIGYNSPA